MSPVLKDKNIYDLKCSENYNSWILRCDVFSLDFTSKNETVRKVIDASLNIT